MLPFAWSSRISSAIALDSLRDADESRVLLEGICCCATEDGVMSDGGCCDIGPFTDVLDIEVCDRAESMGLALLWSALRV